MLQACLRPEAAASMTEFCCSAACVLLHCSGGSVTGACWGAPSTYLASS